MDGGGGGGVWPDCRRRRGNTEAASSRVGDSGVNRLLQRAQDLLDDFAFVDNALGERFVLIDFEGFAGVDDSVFPGSQRCWTSTEPSSTATSVASSSSSTLTSKVVPRTEITAVGVMIAIWVGLPAPLLDVDFHAADQQIQELAQIPGILTENNVGTGIDLENAAIGNLELGITVWAGDNDLLGLDLIANIERPRFVSGVSSTETCPVIEITWAAASVGAENCWAEHTNADSRYAQPPDDSGDAHKSS